MKQRSKVIATSIATIAMCASLAVGGTFALFTSESEVNIAVTSGTVDVKATATNLDKSNLYSQEAAIDGGMVSISNMIPGDSITFDVEIKNYSTVTANYRTILTSEDGGLADALTISFDKATTKEPISFLGGYGVDDWTQIAAAKDGGEIVETITVTIAFNSQGNDIDNLYQGKSCAYKVYVEAVQGNAPMVDPIKKDLEETDKHSDTYYIYSEEGMRLMTGIADSQLASMPNEFYLNFKLMADLDMTGYTYYPTRRYFVKFDGNGHTIENLTAVHNPNDEAKKAGLFGYSVSVKNVTLKNVNVTGNQAALVVSSPEGNTISNVTIAGNNSVSWVDSGKGWKDGAIGAVVGVAYRTTLTDITLADNVTITLNYNDCVSQLDYADDELGGHFYVLGDPTDLSNITFGNNAKIVKNGDWAYLATDAKSLNYGASKGYNVKMTGDISAPLSGTAIYGTPVAVIQKGGVLDGKGYPLDIQNPQYNGYAIETWGGTIKNLTIKTKVGRGIVISSPNQDVYLDNVFVDGPGYAVNTTEHNGKKLIVTNSTIKGWTSLAGLDFVSFENCAFGENTSKYWQEMGYGQDYDRLIRPYVNTTFTNCDFEQGYYFDLSALAASNTITLNNCTCGENAVTAETFMQYLTIEIKVGQSIVINGKEVKCVGDGIFETNGTTVIVASNQTSLETALNNASGETAVVLGSGNYIIPDSAQGKTLKIVGNGDTVVGTQDDGSYEGCDYSLRGATVTFENVTINTDSHTYTGYAGLKATYNNCTINGTYTLYDDSVFNNCTFNVSGDVYNIWTWGASTVEFNKCTFNSDGKAVLLYGGTDTKLTVNNCVFNDKGGLSDLKAAIEIGNDYNKSYELIVNNTIVNGYEINDKGINTGSTLWANKNSMGTDKLNVVVDGVDVY